MVMERRRNGSTGGMVQSRLAHAATGPSALAHGDLGSNRCIWDGDSKGTASGRGTKGHKRRCAGGEHRARPGTPSCGMGTGTGTAGTAHSSPCHQRLRSVFQPSRIRPRGAERPHVSCVQQLGCNKRTRRGLSQRRG